VSSTLIRRGGCKRPEPSKDLHGTVRKLRQLVLQGRWPTLEPPPMPCFTFFHIPISYGNSCRSILTFAPSGPSKEPPKTLARRSKASCLSISQPSIVVIFEPKDHKERTRTIKRANSVMELTTRRVNRWTSWNVDGPRYLAQH